MNFITAIFGIVLGALAASSFIASKSEQAGELIEKLRPAQQWMGIIGLAWGVWGLISVLLNAGILTQLSFLLFISLIGSSAVLACTGFLMGFGLLMSWIGSSEGAKQKSEELFEKLQPYQVTLGLVLIGLSLWALIMAIVV